MIRLSQSLPISSLANLQLSEVAVCSSTPDGMIAYFDFNKSLVLSSKKYSEGLKSLSPGPSDSKLSFSGWVGFFGYEFLAANYGIQLCAKRDLEVPDGWFGRPDSIIRFFQDHTEIESTSPIRENELFKLLEEYEDIDPFNSSLSAKSISCNLNFEDYEDIFARAREAILDGETYQIKISQRYEAEAKIDPLLAFSKLHLANPAPESFLLTTADFSIVSCSPEVVIDKRDDHIFTRPIGGTYERKSSHSEKSVIERFLQDPKEVAEHNMLVDLERNDLATLCKTGSVQLERFREVETYAHLHHLVSTISGRLRAGISLKEILQAMLPGGSITGCPKARTIHWIDQLEPCFRGPYTGSFGTLSDNGDLRLNLIIRAMLVLDDRCYTQAGGGIVVDSTPDYEFNENQLKARALLELLQ